jgi:hypothetical protein
MERHCFGYTKLYGQVPDGQAEYLRVPFGNMLPITVPDGPPDGLKARDKDLAEIVRGLTGGRGPEASINAVGIETHGSSVGKLIQQLTSLLPDGLAEKLSPHALPVLITRATCSLLCGAANNYANANTTGKVQGRGFAFAGWW